MSQIKYLYVIKDLKSGFLEPFAHVNDGTATRFFADLVNTPNGPINLHPDDYELYRCAHYDSNSFNFTDDFEFICGGASCLSKAN